MSEQRGSYDYANFKRCSSTALNSISLSCAPICWGVGKSWARLLGTLPSKADLASFKDLYLVPSGAAKVYQGLPPAFWCLTRCQPAGNPSSPVSVSSVVVDSAAVVVSAAGFETASLA